MTVRSVCSTWSRLGCRRGRKIDMRRRWRNVRVRFQKARLKVQNVLAQLIILVLQRSEVLLHVLEIFDLLFELLNVAFLPLSKGTLRGSVLGCALACTELSFSRLATLAWAQIPFIASRLASAHMSVGCLVLLVMSHVWI